MMSDGHVKAYSHTRQVTREYARAQRWVEISTPQPDLF